MGMTDFLNHLSANDNDIYDLLISGKQRLTASILRELARTEVFFILLKTAEKNLRIDYQFFLMIFMMLPE